MPQRSNHTSFYGGYDAYDRAPSRASYASDSPLRYASPASQPQSHPTRRGVPGALIAILFALLGLVLGAVLGIFLIAPRLAMPQESIPSSLTAAQLDDEVGTFTYDGQVYSITARQAIESCVSVASRDNGDGSYASPTADMVLAYARNQILADEVAAQGITLTDDELNDYMNDYAGTTDISVIAARYSMEEDQARTLVTQAAKVRKLRDAVVGEVAAEPAAPAAPADGNTEVTNQDYATYIIGLLGDDWDAAQGTWANTDNDYYRALQNAAFSPTSANYEAAELAYSVAYRQWSEGAGGQAGQAWTDYVDTLMDKAAITINTLRS